MSNETTETKRVDRRPVLANLEKQLSDEFHRLAKLCGSNATAKTRELIAEWTARQLAGEVRTSVAGESE